MLFRNPGATSSTPTIRTTGGITIGRIVTPSMTRRSRGSRRCTYTVVGSMSAMVSTVVMTASLTDSSKAAEKPSWWTTCGKEEKPVNRSAATSGMTK